MEKVWRASLRSFKKRKKNMLIDNIGEAKKGGEDQYPGAVLKRRKTNVQRKVTTKQRGSLKERGRGQTGGGQLVSLAQVGDKEQIRPRRQKARGDMQ